MIYQHSYKHEWQWNGVAKFVEIIDWCQDNFGSNGWDFKHETFMFDDEKKFVLFLLRWS